MVTVAPKLKGVYCTDIESVEEWSPESDDVCYWLDLYIGDADEPGADIYTVMVATPAGLTTAKQAGKRIGPQPPIIVGEYSWQAVQNEIGVRLSECAGYNWLHVQDLLRKKFRWEYEGYK